MECSGSLAPPFVNNDYVTAEIICSTAHACQEVLTRSEPLCVAGIDELHLESGGTLLLPHGCVCGISQERREYSKYTVMTAASARRE